MTSSRNDRQSPAFTLVEVLVVIVMVGVLSAVTLQGLRMARIQANKAVSSGNLRQLAAANLLYAADHQTYCPTDLNGRNLIRWHGGRSAISAPFDPAMGLLAEYLGTSRQIGMCPQLERMIDASAFNESGAGGYGYNDTYIGGIPSEYLKANRPANVSNPTQTLMFATTAFAVAGGVQEYTSAAPPSEVDTNWRLRGALQPSVHFRFNGKALIAWCDGHVTEEIPSGKSSTNFYGGDNDTADIGFCGPAENNGWWNPRN
jgi:prepilin-type N-terminal cleavage/methylation domain-containing protein/prepilin-type processing-associated H-X9-DG protein